MSAIKCIQYCLVQSIRLVTMLESLDSNKHLFVCVYLDVKIFCGQVSRSVFGTESSFGAVCRFSLL